MKLSEQIRRLREHEQLSQEQLAQQLHVTRQAVYKWENDKGYPDIQNLMILSERCEITIDELIKGDRTFQKNIKVKGAGLFSSRYLLSSLNYFSLFFAPVIFPLITMIAGTAEIKKHGKRALISHLMIPVPIYTLMVLAIHFAFIPGIIGTIFVILTIVGVAVWNVVQGINVLRRQRNGKQ